MFVFLFILVGGVLGPVLKDVSGKTNLFSKTLGLIGVSINNEVVDNSNIGDRIMTPIPKVTNLLVSPKLLVAKTPDTNVTMMTPTVSPSKTLSLTPIPSEITTMPLPPKLSTAKNSGRVIINEIAWAGTSASATDEWLELYNTESESIDISSWQLISNDDSPKIIFPEGTIIGANAYFLIERTDDNAVSDIVADLYISFGQGGLNNTGEMVSLFDGHGVVIDVVGNVGELWYFGDSSSKNSMERIDPINVGNSVSNWKSFSGEPVNKDSLNNSINGTPKSENSKIVQVVVSTSGSGGDSFSTPTPTPTPTTSPSVSVSPAPSPTTTPSPTPSSSDSSGSSVTPSPTTTPTPEPSVFEVVINEIAWMGTATSSNDEWMELYNTTDTTIDLTGWTLKSKDGTPNITLFGTISSLSFYLLERTNDSVISDLTADKIYSGALGNSGESLELRDSSGNIKDSVNFASGWPFGDNTTKSSMERIDPYKSGDDTGNWITNNGIHRNGINAGGGPINGTPRASN